MRGWRTVGRGLLVSYALLWALVLPFICWGAWAAPGHPHRAPHFVFAKPQLVPTESGVPPLSYLAYADHTAVAHAHSDGRACHAPDPGEVSGVAHPESLLVTILVVLLSAGQPWLRPRTAHFAQTVMPLYAADRPLAPPTPPPRRNLAGLVAT